MQLNWLKKAVTDGAILFEIIILNGPLTAAALWVVTTDPNIIIGNLHINYVILFPYYKIFTILKYSILCIKIKMSKKIFLNVHDSSNWWL